MYLIKYLSAIILALALLYLHGCASTSSQESTGEYIDDSIITSKIKVSLFNDPSLKSTEINVETYKGIVQLSGFVSSDTDINRAIDLTRGVTGVKSIMNDMRIKH